MLLEIAENKSFARDSSSMAIINVDKAAKGRYKTQRDLLLKDKKSLADAQRELATLKVQMQELQELVARCVQNAGIIG